MRKLLGTALFPAGKRTSRFYSTDSARFLPRPIHRLQPSSPSLEVEPHALAAERQHTEHAVDARRVSVRHSIERPGWQLVPDVRSEAGLAQLEPPQARRAGRILHRLVASPRRT